MVTSNKFLEQSTVFCLCQFENPIHGCPLKRFRSHSPGSILNFVLPKIEFKFGRWSVRYKNVKSIVRVWQIVQGYLSEHLQRRERCDDIAGTTSGWKCVFNGLVASFVRSKVTFTFRALFVFMYFGFSCLCSFKMVLNQELCSLYENCRFLCLSFCFHRLKQGERHFSLLIFNR